MNQTKRIEWLDCAKGIAIMLVVLGHAVTTSIRTDSLIAQNIYNWVYYIHMPLFMTLSGISYQLAQSHYQNETIGNFIKKKAKRLLVPYVVYVSVVYIIFSIANMLPKIGHMMQNAGYGLLSFKQFFSGMLLGDNFYCIHMWYIYVLFILSVLTFLLKKYLPKFADIILFVFVVAVYIIQCQTGFPQVKSFSNMFCFAIWYFLGLKLPISKLNNCIGYGSFLIGITVYLLTYFNVFSYANLQGWFVIDFFVKGCIILGIIFLISMFCTYKNKLLQYLGNHSMEIYLFHQPFWGSCFGSVFYGVFHLPLWFVVSASFILSIGVSLIIGYFLRKTKLKVLFGLK